MEEVFCFWEGVLSYVTGLRCKECGKTYPISPHVVCDCIAPLEVSYDMDGWKKVMTRD